MLVLDRAYRLLRMNRGAACLWSRLPTSRATESEPAPNLLVASFDPAGFRPHILNWEPLARVLLARLHREILADGADTRLTNLRDTLLSLPGVPEAWRQPDFRRGD